MIVEKYEMTMGSLDREGGRGGGECVCGVGGGGGGGVERLRK